MAGPDLTIALARLLCDHQLRAAFATDPTGVARDLALPPHDRDIFCAMDPVALERQAKALLRKRRDEVARLVPLSWQRLGSAALARFDEYASASWPVGHRRHAEDALAFLRFLASHRLVFAPIEARRLDTRLSDRRLRICLVSRAGRWMLPGLYVAWRTPRGWRDRLVHVGPASAQR